MVLIVQLIRRLKPVISLWAGCARTCRLIFKVRCAMAVHNRLDQIKPVESSSLGTGLNDDHLWCTTSPLRGPRVDHCQGPRQHFGQLLYPARVRDPSLPALCHLVPGGNSTPAQHHAPVT
ncbi:hypothetical protein TIFTF001_014757 [Ficus carica]|uniref:Uncharacterized protein n=1 Tax=Ficus carica TaxID=3494 RepID=A0AA88A3B9_FICCA|nr:hypothetical protein TIFTF001_014757 [Ficus carica]